MRWEAADDGSLTLVTRRCPSFAAAYPAIDGVAIRPLSVSVRRAHDGVEIVFVLPLGRLVVNARTDGERATLATALSAWQGAPGEVMPVAHARMVGAVAMFRQAHGMAGGSAWCDPTGVDASHALSALRGADGAALSLSHDDTTRFACVARGSADGLAFGFICEGCASGDVVLPTLAFGEHDDSWLALTTAADVLARAAGARRRQHPSRHWCSWYEHYHHFSAALLDQRLHGFAAASDRFGLDSVQIDAGYSAALGDWLEPCALWPHGVGEALAGIARAGFRPGLWIGPFMVGCESALARDHEDWLLRGCDGRPLVQLGFYGENRLWGYADREYHALDTSHPAAFAYLREVFRALRRWGVRYLKTDFMFWGLHDARAVQRHAPGRTSVEELRRVLAMIREEMGEDCYWLGCIAPFAPLVGFVDGMRIGGDVGPGWVTGSHDPRNMLGESAGSMHLDHRWFQVDNDAVIVRDRHTAFAPHEIETLALWQAFTGGCVGTSDALDQLPPERQRLWRFLDPGAEPIVARPIAVDAPLLAATRPLAGGVGVLVINPGESPARWEINHAAVGLAERTPILRWRPGEATPAPDGLRCVIPAHGSALFYAGDGSPAALTLAGRPLT